MAQMGYTPGMGLGKEEAGRKNAIQVRDEGLRFIRFNLFDFILPALTAC